MPKKIKFSPPKKLPKKVRQAHRQQNLVLDLHNLEIDSVNTTENIVTSKLDNFLTPFLYKTGIHVHIIVGRGLNTDKNSLINGIPPLRYYTNNYLNKIAIKSNYDNEKGTFNILF
jgi:hypothetical protein